MIVQSRPIPIHQRQDVRFNGRNKRFSTQRMQAQNKYPSPPQGSPPQVPGFPSGNVQVWPSSPPMQPPPVGNFPGYAFPTGACQPENVNAFAQQDQCVDLRAKTLSPPAGFCAVSMRGFAGSPPYPMPLGNGYSPPFNAQSSNGVYYSMPPQHEEVGERPQVMYQQQMFTTQLQACWPQNQFSPPYPVTFVPSPPVMQLLPCGVNGCEGCLPPPPQREEFFANNFPLFRPMPVPKPYVMDPSYMGTMPEVVEPPPKPEVVEPPPMPDEKDKGTGNGSRWVRKRRARGKCGNVPSDNQVMKIAEQENWRLGNRQRSSSTPAIGSPFCSFCRSNRETPQFYQSHVLKNDDGVTSCPVLRKYTCPICKAVGDNAHTLKYCPENEDGALGPRGRSMSLSSQKSALKLKRNSRGIIGAYRYG